MPCCQQKHKEGHEFKVAFFSFKLLACFYWMGLFAIKSRHSHLVPTEPWDFDIFWNILWFVSAAKSSAPSQPAQCCSEGNQSCHGLKVTYQQWQPPLRSCQVPLVFQASWKSRGEGERKRRKQRKTDSWEEVKPEMLCPRGIYQPKWNGNSERETLLCFSQNCISSWMSWKENILSFSCDFERSVC